MSELQMGIVHEVFGAARQRMTAGFQKFINGLKEGKFLTTQCKKCGKKFMPPRFDCPCGSKDMEWFEVKPEGTLYTWTIVHFAPEGIARKTNVPYAAGIIEFEDNLHLLGHIKGLTSKPKVGMKVKIAPEIVGESIAYYIKPA
jgi:uncharacterized OB-fold protein